jgi:hypothetical protein
LITTAFISAESRVLTTGLDSVQGSAGKKCRDAPKISPSFELPKRIQAISIAIANSKGITVKCRCSRFNVGLTTAGLISIVSLTQFLTDAHSTETQEATGQEVATKDDVRFDHKVREDFFAGFQGDETSLQRGIKTCREVLEKEPKHAEAMVWLGSGQVYLSGQFFSKGQVAEGMKNWQAGLENMNKAAELEPDNIGVLIPRAAVLMPASRNLPPAIRNPVVEGVRKNFEHVYEMQKGMLSDIGEHPLGELRMGLADVYRTLGKLDESKAQLEAVVKELPDSDYAKVANKWLAAKPDAKLAHNCIGCHSK